MLSHMPTVLAASELITIIVVAVLFILGGIFGNSKQQKGKTRRSGGAAGGSGGSGSVGLDELARRRRAQLEALARQRSGGGRGALSPVPDNMNVAEASEREAARAAYAARAAELQREQDAMRAAREAAMEERRRAQALEAEASRRAQLDRMAQRGRQQQQLKRRRKRPALPQQHEPLDLRQEDMTLRIESAGEPTRIGTTPLGRGATEVDAFAHPAGADVEQVHRHVPDVSASEAAVRKSFLGQLMTSQDWRRMVVMREVLDKPVSMRDEQG